MRISDWSSDVCSSDLLVGVAAGDAERTQVDEREVGIGAARDDIGAARLQPVRECLRVSDRRLRIDLELRTQRLAEGDRLRGDDVHPRADTQARDDGPVDEHRDRLVTLSPHAHSPAAPPYL